MKVIESVLNDAVCHVQLKNCKMNEEGKEIKWTILFIDGPLAGGAIEVDVHSDMIAEKVTRNMRENSLLCKVFGYEENKTN
jgi:hypothetical protein